MGRSGPRGAGDWHVGAAVWVLGLPLSKPPGEIPVPTFSSYSWGWPYLDVEANQ